MAEHPRDLGCLAISIESRQARASMDDRYRAESTESRPAPSAEATIGSARTARPTDE
jgi:hypothetical protein